MVAFAEAEAAQLTQSAIEETAALLQISSEFKFNKSRNEVRDAFFKAVLPCEFRVRAIVVQKERIYSPHLRAKKEAFYAFFVRSMLTYDGGLLKDAKIVIDGSGDRAFKRELAGYLRRQLPEGGLKDLRFSNSANDRLVQLADMCAGAIARSYKPQRPHAARWRVMLEPKIDDVWEFR